MIKDLTTGFGNAQQLHPSLVQDNYKLKDGLYIRIVADQNWQEQSESFVQNHLIINVKEDEPQKVELLDWLKKRDYDSALINMNKSVDPKKQIHSNNPFALFAKREVFLGEKQELKFNMHENINRFIAMIDAEQVRLKWVELMSAAKKGENTSDELSFFHESDYAQALDYLNSSNRRQWIERISHWYLINIEPLSEFIRHLTFKNYVKLFFSLDSPTTSEFPTYTCEQIYTHEYTLYTIPKIYNSNDYNQLVDGELVGLPSLDMTMNSKKPFLEHRTMRIEAPDRVSLEEALLAKESLDWLITQPKYTTNKLGYESGFAAVERNSYLIEGTLHVYVDGKDNELHGFENVPFPPTVPFEVEWLNVLQLKARDYRVLNNSEMLQREISSKFFRGRMNGQFVFNEPDVKSKEFTAVMVALFLQCKQAFHDWFYKGTTISIKAIFAKITLRLLEEQLVYVETAKVSDLADAFNLRLSIRILLKEEEGQTMADHIGSTVVSLRKKLVNKEDIVVCTNDYEFYFLAGQLAFYLTSQSKAAKKTGDSFEPFLRARSGQQIKKQLNQTYLLYKHEISMNHRKFNNAFSMVMGYEPDEGNEGETRELLLAGIFANNLFYEKSEQGVIEDEQDE